MFWSKKRRAFVPPSAEWKVTWTESGDVVLRCVISRRATCGSYLNPEGYACKSSMLVICGSARAVT